MEFFLFSNRNFKGTSRHGGIHENFSKYVLQKYYSFTNTLVVQHNVKVVIQQKISKQLLEIN